MADEPKTRPVRIGRHALLTCPKCNGTTWEIAEIQERTVGEKTRAGQIVVYHCRRCDHEMPVVYVATATA